MMLEVKYNYGYCAVLVFLTLWTPEAGIPTFSRQTSLRRQKLVYRRHGMSTPVPEVCIPTARCINARRQKSVYRLFSNAYWHRNARFIEIQTRQQLKNNFFHETQRIFMNKFCIWTPSCQCTS